MKQNLLLAGLLGYFSSLDFSRFTDLPVQRAPRKSANGCKVNAIKGKRHTSQRIRSNRRKAA